MYVLIDNTHLDWEDILKEILEFRQVPYIMTTFSLPCEKHYKRYTTYPIKNRVFLK